MQPHNLAVVIYFRVASKFGVKTIRIEHNNWQRWTHTHTPHQHRCLCRIPYNLKYVKRTNGSTILSPTILYCGAQCGKCLSVLFSPFCCFRHTAFAINKLDRPMRRTRWKQRPHKRRLLCDIPKIGAIDCYCVWKFRNLCSYFQSRMYCDWNGCTHAQRQQQKSMCVAQIHCHAQSSNCATLLLIGQQCGWEKYIFARIIFVSPTIHHEHHRLRHYNYYFRATPTNERPLVSVPFRRRALQCVSINFFFISLIVPLCHCHNLNILREDADIFG